MGSFSMAHWLVVAVVVLVLFGRGKISETMGDFGKGIRSFKKGISEGDVPEGKLPAAGTANPALTADEVRSRNCEDSRSASPE
jgi:sec-independent protein translocase protein TatA